MGILYRVFAAEGRGARLGCLLLVGVASAWVRAAEPVEIAIQFLDGDGARSAIVDETNDPYFKLLQPMEMAAKTGGAIPGNNLDQQRNECRQRYQTAVLSWTNEDKETLMWYVGRMVQATAKYPLISRSPWSFIKVADRIEGGQPFTRGRQIVIPISLLIQMTTRRKEAAVARAPVDSEWMALLRFGSILAHERCHVVQREYPQRFARLYTDHWSLTHAESIEGDQWLTEHQLLDPDATDQRWVFAIKEQNSTRWIWPLAVLQDSEDPTGPTFKDMRMIAVDLEPLGGGGFRVKTGAGGRAASRPLMSEPKYVNLFRPSREIFAPNEASADLFARIVSAESLPGTPPAEAREALDNARQMFKTLQEWFVRILKVAE